MLSIHHTNFLIFLFTDSNCAGVIQNIKSVILHAKLSLLNKSLIICNEQSCC